MYRQPLPDDWVPRYLRFLGVAPETPGPDALARLIRAQILAVPFGNVTALRRYARHGDAVPALDLDQLLRGWEDGTGTAVCFEGTEAFGHLLRALGYDARPIPGFIAGFVGGHQALLITLGAARYLADVANGAPFFAPVPLGAPFAIHHAGLSYRFRPGDGPDDYLQDRLLDGAWVPFCRYFLRDQGADERAGHYRRHHRPHESFVIAELRLVRCTPDAVIGLRGGTLAIFTAAGKETATLASEADVARVVREEFGLPHLPIAEVSRTLAALPARS